MSALVMFDIESGFATISLKDWPFSLRSQLGRYFDIQEDNLRLDYSHLSAEEIWGHEERPSRKNFVLALQAAAQEGRMALFTAILGDRSGALRDSSSILDKETYPLGSESLKWVTWEFQDLRATVVAEITPTTTWVSWLFASNARSDVLGDQEVMEVLIFRTTDNDCIRCLQLVRPKEGENSQQFEKIIQKHWDYICNFISEHISIEDRYGHSETVDLIASLFLHSSRVRESRWVTEKVRDHASPTTFPRVIQHCPTLTVDDVRLLLQRLEARDSAKIDDLKKNLAAAYSALGPILNAPIPSDLALAGIWHELQVAAAEFEVTSSQQAVVSKLEELSLASSGKVVLWNRLGPAAREAWRQELFDLVKGDHELAQGLIDFACLWFDQFTFAEIEPVLLRLIDDGDNLAFVQRRAKAGPRQVQLRVMGLARSKLGEPDLGEVADDGISLLPSVGAKTWLGDPSVERVIHLAVGRAEKEFCHEYPGTWGEDEEAHTSRILTLTQTAAREAAEHLRQLSHATSRSFPTLSVNVRQPPKHEEGANTSAGAPLGSDILFLTRIVEKGEVLIKRATLVQVKKRRGTGSGKGFSSTIAVDLKQCKDMLTQTEHAYYLFLTPSTSQSALWVAPARLVGNLTQIHTSKSSVLVAHVRDSSCSYADFFLHYLVGLWAGDEKDSVIEIAEGDPLLGRTPRHIVEVEVRRQEE